MPVLTMSDSEYFVDPAIDQTSLKKYLISPLAYADYCASDRSDSIVFDFGKAAHSLILGAGPEILVKPNLRTKTGKTEYEALLAEHEDEDIVWLSEADYDTVHAMSDMIGSFFQQLPGKPEQALFADDEQTRLPLKGKADWLPDKPDDDGVYRIYDYKTTSKPASDFTREAWLYGYHIQAAFYMRLWRLTHPDLRRQQLGFCFVVQEKQTPFDYMLWRFNEDSPEITQIANPMIDHALAGIKWFTDNHGDPLKAMRAWGYDKTPQTIQFPDWKLLDDETVIDSWR